MSITLSDYLTPTQRRLWAVLAAANGRAVDYTTLIRRGMGRRNPRPEDYVNLKVHIANMRARMPEGTINTVIGVGYLWAGGSCCPECGQELPKRGAS